MAINEIVTHSLNVALAVSYSMIPTGLVLILGAGAFGIVAKFIMVTVWPK